MSDLITRLHEPVHGDPADEGVGEELEDGEEGEDDPVHQPLRVVILPARLESLDRPAKEKKHFNHLKVCKKKLPMHFGYRTQISIQPFSTTYWSCIEF